MNRAMKTFQISLNMRTCRAIETYACFTVGCRQTFAQNLFDALEGRNEVSTDSVITIDLMMREEGIPYPLALKHCTIDQLAENVKLITKELFKQYNLEI